MKICLLAVLIHSFMQHLCWLCENISYNARLIFFCLKWRSIANTVCTLHVIITILTASLCWWNQHFEWPTGNIYIFKAKVLPVIWNGKLSWYAYDVPLFLSVGHLFDLPFHFIYCVVLLREGQSHCDLFLHKALVKGVICVITILSISCEMMRLCWLGISWANLIIPLSLL